MVHTYNPGACCFVSRMENRTLQHLPSVNLTYCMTTRVDITWLLHKNVHWTLMGFTRGVPIAHYEVKVKKVRFGSFLSVPVCAKDMQEWEAAESCLCFNPANWFAVSKHQTWHRLVQPLCQLMCNFVSTTVSPTHVYQKTPPPPPPPPPPYHHHAGAQKVLKMLSSCTHMNIRMNGGQEHTDDQLIRKCVHVALHQVWVRVTARVVLEKKLMASASSPASTITCLQQHRIFCLLFSTISHAYKCTSFQWGQLRETWVIGWFTLS